MNESAFAIDYQASIFQTLYGYAKEDIQINPMEGRPMNKVTGTYPAVVHANGWDKGPLLDIARRSGRITDKEAHLLAKAKVEMESFKTLQNRESGINKRCKWFNPNAVVDPTKNLIADYGLESRQKILAERLNAQKVGWKLQEEQLWEVQEYLGFCPMLQSWTSTVLVDVRESSTLRDFLVYVYPLSTADERRLSPVYQEIRAAFKIHPRVTDKPSQATFLLPNVDTSCWCESCMGRSRQFDSMAPESVALSQALMDLPYWKGGQNHVIFEYSDAPCVPYDVGMAAVASVGTSRFHYRPGHDVSLPLFSMVEFSSKQRAVPAALRRHLLTFRGTRSSRSDQTRKHVWRLHNGDDIIMACACRWFDPLVGAESGYDARCASDEQVFENYTYTSLMTDTKFSLILEGFGYLFKACCCCCLVRMLSFICSIIQLSV